jgi:hypothetical protein
VVSPPEFMRRLEATMATHDIEATLKLIADDAVYDFLGKWNYTIFNRCHPVKESS